MKKMMLLFLVLAFSSCQNYIDKEGLKELLVGNWQFKEHWDYLNYIHTSEGTVEYAADGTLKKNITDEYQKSSYEEYLGKKLFSYLVYKGGGSVTGTYQVIGEKTWREDWISCDYEISYNVDDQNFSPCDSTATYVFGNETKKNYKTEIKILTQDKIEIKGTRFSDGAKITYTLERIKD